MNIFEKVCVDAASRMAIILFSCRRLQRKVWIKLPSAHDWRTTDTDEISKRRQRAREESFVIINTTP